MNDIAKYKEVASKSNRVGQYLIKRWVVGCIYLTLKKLQQKVSQRFIVVLGVLNNKNLTMQKIFFSRWRPRWPPDAKNSNYLLIYHPK